MNETKCKKARRECSFNIEWLSDPSNSSWLSKFSSDTARCTVCSVNFTVKYDGIKAVITHRNSEKHKSFMRSGNTSHAISAFFPEEHSLEEDLILSAELAMVYHGVMHHHSYLSMDCCMKIIPAVFPDSKIAKKIHCGRTKSEALIANVLCPHSIEMVTNEMNFPKSIFYSVSTDASNKGNLKHYPLALRYFLKSFGTKNRVIDFYVCSEETSDSISSNILSRLEHNQMNIQYLISYGADNAAVNYGKHHSVFTNLRQLCPKLISSNCNCHVIHNSARFGCKVMSRDIELLVIKIFNEFSISAKRVKELKSCFEFLDIEYKELLRHVPTRWLSLLPALDRLLLSWPAVKVYFLQLGEEECPKFIWDFIKDQEHELNAEDELSLNECFLYFIHSFMNIFQESIKKLEDNATQSPEVYNIMFNLKSKMIDRLNDGFYGFRVNQCIPKLQKREQVQFKAEANRVFQRIISYLEKWFDYEGSVYKHIQIFNLHRIELSFDEFTKTAFLFQIKINGDEMYDEFCLLREWLVNQRDNLLPIDEQWVAFFTYANCPNFLSLVEFALALPVSNAYVERIFSLMKNLWTDERNRLSTEMVKAELCFKLNYSLSCKEFYNFIKQEKRLLKIAKLSDKYKQFHK